MYDLRPVGNVIGLLVAILGALMLAPMVLDWRDGNGHWPVFLQSATVTMLGGVFLSLSCGFGKETKLTLQQTFLLTSSVWLVLPLFGGIPLMAGTTDLSFTDAFFEAMSGMTTTGSTVISGLDNLPRGLLLWRGIIQWIGGVGIIVVAMVFLPELRLGGMQIFRSEAFDTDGKILPRATEIASRISSIYLLLTVMCALAYVACGMSPFDAVVHSMTTIATGGMSNYDTSFVHFAASAHYVASFFMILAALPFVRFVQLLAGHTQPLWADSQIRVFFGIIAAGIALLTSWQVFHGGENIETAFRETMFNSVSIITGTGYASADYTQWGTLPVMVIFFAGLVGGCAGSTACSVKVFRYQLLFSSIIAQLRKVRSPNSIVTPRYNGKVIDQDTLNSVMSFFVFFILTIGLVAWALSLTGLDFVTSVSGAATAVANIGPGLGTQIGPAGNFAGLSDTAKWILALAMWAGRLEILGVFVLFTTKFWRA
jgi:trk system potassium uptake protein TrkH